MSEDIFWLDGFYGEAAQGGLFVRNDLFKFMERLRDSGREPVAIRVDGSWNLEVLVKPIDGEEQGVDG